MSLKTGRRRFGETKESGSVVNLPAMTVREVEAILQRVGFDFVRQTSHRIWQKGARSVPVPAHPGDVPPGTVRNIIKLAGMTIEEFLGYR